MSARDHEALGEVAGPCCATVATRGSDDDNDAYKTPDLVQYVVEGHLHIDRLQHCLVIHSTDVVLHRSALHWWVDVLVDPAKGFVHEDHPVGS